MEAQQCLLKERKYKQMTKLLIRERIPDATCFAAARIGIVLRFRVRAPFFIIGTGPYGTTLLV